MIKMKQSQHASHSGIVKRLKRAEEQLRHVVEMIDAGRPCVNIAVRLQAIERAIFPATRTLIHDHIDHCLGTGGVDHLAEVRAMAKLL